MADDCQNLILGHLSAEERSFVISGAKRVPLALGDVLHRADEPVEFVIFPEFGVISIITENELGESAESGLVGREAAALLPEALGSGRSTTTGTVQVAGEALKVRASECRRLYAESPRFRAAMAAASEFQLIESRQALLCRSFHKVEGRLARWILEQAQRDNRADEDLVLTQEFLASMLAVHRPTVSRAAKSLQTSGAIEYRRGRVTLRDRPRLEALACPCRANLEEQRERIFDGDS